MAGCPGWARLCRQGRRDKAERSPVIEPLQEVGAQPGARSAGNGMAKHKALEGSRTRAAQGPEKAESPTGAKTPPATGERGAATRGWTGGLSRLLQSTATATRSSGHFCNPAHATERNGCSGSPWIPPAPKQLQRDLQSPVGHTKCRFSVLSRALHTIPKLLPSSLYLP